MNTASLVNLNRSGRKAGSKNQHTVEIRAMIEAALDKAGGVDYLVEQAHENPAAFLALVGRILPKEVRAEHRGEVGIQLIQRVIVDARKESG